MARAIMISEHLYKELSEMKVEGEIYTKVIDKLIHKKTQKKKTPTDFLGAWNVINKKDLDDIEEEAKKTRKTWREVPKW